MSKKFDLNDDGVVVVIGSGAGGGTLGSELAQKGVKTVILDNPDLQDAMWSLFEEKVKELIRHMRGKD